MSNINYFFTKVRYVKGNLKDQFYMGERRPNDYALWRQDHMSIVPYVFSFIYMVEVSTYLGLYVEYT